MKLIFTVFVLAASIAMAESSGGNEIPHTPPNHDQDIKGSITAPTAEQVKPLEEHAKKHAKKKNKKKSKKAAKDADKKTN